MQIVERERLLTPGEVAARFRVTAKTVTRWADEGKLTSIRTLGGHRRFRETEVSQLIGRADHADPGNAATAPGGAGGDRVT